MLRIFLPLILSILAVSCCEPRYVDYFPYHDNGCPKPRVALVPVGDCSNVQLAWNGAEELTSGIRYEMMSNGELYLLSPQEVDAGLARLGDIDLFAKNVFFDKCFCDAEFVVLIDIIGHGDECIVSPPYKISLRLKVIDIRPACKQVILQEIFTNSYSYPYRSNSKNYSTLTYLDPHCSRITFFGLALQPMVRTLTDRLETVILGAH